MSSWEPVDIDRDEISDGDVKWDDDVMKDLESRFEELRQYDRNFNESHDEATREDVSIFIDATRHDIEELVANEMYDKLITMFNNDRKRFGIQKSEPVLNPIRKYDNFKLADDGKMSYVHKRMVIDLGNINERLKSPWEIRRIGVSKLKLMGFVNITDEDVNPYEQKYKKAREKVRILNEDLNGRSKTIESSSTTDAEAIEMIEVTSKDIDTTVKDVEQDTSFIKPIATQRIRGIR